MFKNEEKNYKKSNKVPVYKFQIYFKIIRKLYVYITFI